ncbi:hypothetical protein BDW62DRAFT_186471 [Aspergillus aurantiobrunneus]
MTTHQATDPPPPNLEQTETDQDEFDRLFRAERDSEAPTTTRRELWSYYLYYNGRHAFPLLWSRSY